MDFDDLITPMMAHAMAEEFDRLVGDALFGSPAGPGPQGIISAQKLSAYVTVSDELLHPENYPPKPITRRERLSRLRWRIQSMPTRARRAVGFWIAGHNPDEDESW